MKQRRASQERAKMMRKGATKMGPHQADSVLKAALNENGQNMTELGKLDGLQGEQVEITIRVRK